MEVGGTQNLGSDLPLTGWVTMIGSDLIVGTQITLSKKTEVLIYYKMGTVFCERYFNECPKTIK